MQKIPLIERLSIFIVGALCLVLSSVALAAPITPQVKLLSPNTSKTFPQGKTISLKAKGSPHIMFGLVKDSVQPKTEFQNHELLGWIADIKQSNYTAQFKWDGWQVCDAQLENCSIVPAGKYKIIAVGKDANGNMGIWNYDKNEPGNWDVSKKAFTITATTPQFMNSIVTSPKAKPFGNGSPFSYVDLRPGKALTVKHKVKATGMLGLAWEWKYDDSHLEMTKKFAPDSNRQRFVAKNANVSTIHVDAMPVMADGKRVISSNVVTVRTNMLPAQKRKAGKIKSFTKIGDLWKNFRKRVELTQDAQWNTKKRKVLVFDYRLAPDAKVSLGLETAQNKYFFPGQPVKDPRIEAKAFINFVQDGAWHRARIPVYNLVGDQDITKIWFEDLETQKGTDYQFDVANVSRFVKNVNPVVPPVVIPSTVKVTATAGPQVDRNVLAGSPDVLLGTFQMNNAAQEVVKVEKLTLQNIQPSGNDSINVVMIKYPKDPTKPFDLNGQASGVLNQNGEVTFANLDMQLPANSNVVSFQVHASLHSIAQGADSGDAIQIRWVATTDSAKFSATGISSGTTSHDSGAQSDTNMTYVRKAIISASITSTSTQIQYGSDVEVFKFRVFSAGNEVDLHTVSFDVSHFGLDTSVIEGQSWNLYSAFDQSTVLASGKLSGGKLKLTFTTPRIIGLNEEFVLKAPITQDQDQATDSALLIRFAQDSAFAPSGTAAAMAAAHNFVWSDKSAAAHSLTTTDWINGYALSIQPNYWTLR